MNITTTLSRIRHHQAPPSAAQQLLEGLTADQFMQLMANGVYHSDDLATYPTSALIEYVARPEFGICRPAAQQLAARLELI